MKRIHKVLVFALLSSPTLPARADDSYLVSKTDAVVTVGSKGKATVTIAAKKGWHLNAEAPLTLKLGTTPGLETDKAKLGRSDLAQSSETQARFDIAVTASEPGKKALEAEAGFVLCQEDACRPVKAKLTLAVEATPPEKAEKAEKTKKVGTKK
jgi:hypothetical protein